MGWHLGAQRTGTQRSVDSGQRTSPGGGGGGGFLGRHRCTQPGPIWDPGSGLPAALTHRRPLWDFFLHGVAAPGKPTGCRCKWTSTGSGVCPRSEDTRVQG